mgnify:CR=1 FL=1
MRSIEQQHLSKSLEQVNKFKFLSKGPYECLTSKVELFSEDEFRLLKEKVPESKLKQFMKKFNDISNSKEVQSKKLIEELKSLNRKLYECEERLEYNLLQLKERDHKNKIYNFQINTT